MATLKFKEKEGDFEKKVKPKYYIYKRYLYLSIAANFAMVCVICLLINKFY